VVAQLALQGGVPETEERRGTVVAVDLAVSSVQGALKELPHAFVERADAVQR
jgi:hypothetical protein